MSLPYLPPEPPLVAEYGTFQKWGRRHGAVWVPQWFQVTFFFIPDTSLVNTVEIEMQCLNRDANGDVSGETRFRSFGYTLNPEFPSYEHWYNVRGPGVDVSMGEYRMLLTTKFPMTEAEAAAVGWDLTGDNLETAHETGDCLTLIPSPVIDWTGLLGVSQAKNWNPEADFFDLVMVEKCLPFVSLDGRRGVRPAGAIPGLIQEKEMRSFGA